MKRVRVTSVAVLLIAMVASVARAQDPSGMKMSAVPQTSEWQKLRSLVGQWEGVVEQDGKQVPATVEVRMTGDGSAVMHVMGRDTPHEMVTMFHPDGRRLLATHYCAAHNQPRMALVPASAPNQVAFEFVDGTNIAPGDMHMKGLVITFVDADHHVEAWTDSGGGPATVFHYTRKNGPMAAVAAPAVTDVTATQAHTLIQERSGKPGFVILDVRTPAEFADGHLAGAMNLDARAPDFDAQLGLLDRARTYLVYCRSGNRSRRAVQAMEGLGFTSVLHMMQGIVGWQEQKLPVVPPR